jgi:hypothetical protein
VFAILACAHDITAHGTPEKQVRVCFDSLAALKALSAVTTTSPFVCQCQEALNEISARHVVGLFWVPGHAGVRGNETADGFARNVSATGFGGPEPALGVSRQDLRNKIGRRLGNQHRRRRQDLCNSQRQFENLYRYPVGVPGLGFYPLIGYNPGWLRDFLLGIIPCADTSS